MSSKKSVVYFWLFSYLMIALIAVSIMVALYFSTVKTVRDDTLHANELSLSATRDSIDAKLIAIRSTANLMADDFRIIKPRVNTSFDTPDDNYSLYAAYSAIGSYITSNSAISGGYVYYHNTDTIVSNATIAPSARYHALYIGGGTYEQWLGLLRSQYSGDFISASLSPDSDELLSCYISTLSASGKNAANGATLVIPLNMKRLVAGIYSGQGQLIILSENEFQLFPATGSAPTFILPPGMDKSGVSVVSHNQNGEQYTLSIVKSAVAPWYYAVAIPHDLFFKKMQQTQMIMTTGILLCVILSLSLIAIFIKLNYTPVKRLMGMIDDAALNDLRGMPNHNEFAYISQAISRLRTPPAGDGASGEALRAYALGRVLSTTPDGDPPRSILEFYGVQLPLQNYIVATFRCDDIDFDPSHDAPVPGGMSPVGYYEYAHMTQNNLLDAMLPAPNGFSLYRLSTDGIVVCVIDAPDPDCEMLACFGEIADKIRQVASEQYYVGLSCAVSGVYHQSEHLRTAYHEALSRLTFSSACDSEAFYFPDDMRKQLVDAVNAADASRAQYIIYTLFAENFSGDAAGRSNTRVFVTRIVSLAFTIMERAGIATDKNMRAVADKTDKLSMLDNPAYVRQELVSIYEFIIVQMKSKADSFIRDQYARMTQRVKEYIDQNFTDSNLSLAVVAEAFDINPAQLSRIFRENALESLPDYINRIRVGRAKELIGANDYHNLITLAERIGFTNTKTLVRAFKRYTGATPSQYRKFIGGPCANIDDTDDLE